MTSSILNPICRGIVGYISYLSACSSSPVYSEYLLYEPILRIAISKGFRVSCEHPVGRIESNGKKKRGDHKRIDFDLSIDREQKRLGIEIKWIKKKTQRLKKDVNNLLLYSSEYNGAPGYLVLFGKSKHFEGLNIKSVKIKSQGAIVEWRAGKTNFSAQWFRIV